MRNSNARGEEALTVAYHPGFQLSTAVDHPRATADKIGKVFDTGLELGVALVSLTSAASANFTNKCYLQAEPSGLLLKCGQIKPGSWSEVDGISSGLVSMLA